MPNSRELLRVGLPTRAVRLHNLIDALDLDHGSEATIRYSRGSLVIEESTATLAKLGDADDAAAAADRAAE